MVPDASLLIWRLRGLIEDVQCYVLPRGMRYRLVVARAGEKLLEEDHATAHATIRRAGELRASLIGVGFEPSPADATVSAPLDSLLNRFVRAGTAPVQPAAARAQ